MINVAAFLNKTVSLDHLSMMSVFEELAAKTIADPNVARLLRDKKENFDVAISEWLLTDIYAGYVFFLFKRCD